ncbi:hypothetical protein J6O48_14105 [bacterium]|nr:hypothetical protein [bacterium]
MTREEFKTYQMLTKKFYECCNDIFSYIKKNYISVLSFGIKSEFCGGDYDNDNIVIIYCYQGHYYDEEQEQIYIPINNFFDEPYKWVDEWANKLIVEKEATRQRLDEIALQKERNEYERLKKKFETT